MAIHVSGPALTEQFICRLLSIGRKQTPWKLRKATLQFDNEHPSSLLIFKFMHPDVFMRSNNCKKTKPEPNCSIASF